MENISRIISRVAEDYNVDNSVVKAEIEAMARHGLCHKDPNIRFFWRCVPHKGELPCAEEIVAYVAFLAAKTKGIL